MPGGKVRPVNTLAQSRPRQTSGVPHPDAASSAPLPDIPAWGAYLGAIAAGLLMFVPLLPRLGELYIGASRTDMKMTYRNWIRHAVRSVSEGEIPLWNPFIYCGQPFMPSTHGTLFYPPNWPFLLTLPQPLSINLSLMTQVAILAAGTVFFARTRGASNMAALLAGVLASLGSVAVCRIFAGHFTMVCTAVWIPVLFALQERLVRGERRMVVPFALAGAVMFMGGHLQYAYYYGVFLGLSLLLLALIGPAPPSGARLGWLGRQAAWHLGAGALAFALVAVEALPALDIASHSMRSAGKNLQFLREFAMPPAQLVTAIAPRFFGQGLDYWGRWEWWEATFHFGVTGLVLALAAAGVRTARARRPEPLTVLFFLCILIAVSGYLPLLPKIFQYVPGWMMFRGHNRPLSFALVFGTILAAHGFDALRADLAGRTSQAARALFLAVSLTAAGLFVAADAEFWRGLLTAPDHVKELFNPNPAASPETLAAATATARASLALAFFLGLAGFALLQWGRRLPPRVWQWAVVAMAAGEMAWFAVPVPSFPPDLNVVPPETAAFMASKSAEARSDVPGMMNEGTGHQIPSIEGNDIVVTRYYNTFLCAYLGLPELYPNMSFILQGESPLLDAANLVYIGMAPQSPAARSGLMPHVANLDRWAVYSRPGALPRAYVVGTARWVPDDDARIHRALMAGDIDFHSEVLLTGEDDGDYGERFPFVPARADYRGLHEVRVRAPRAGWLVLTDGYYPHWKAEIGGQEVPVLRANSAFRAVRVQEGDEVVFRYRNPVFTAGAWISTTALLSLAGWGVVALWRLRAATGAGATA